MIGAASGGALIDKTLAIARHLISNMTNNTQQFGIRGAGPSRMVNEVGAIDNLRLEKQLTKLTSLVRQLAVGQHQPSMAAIVCGICTSMEHPTDMCPTLQETESNHLESLATSNLEFHGSASKHCEPATIGWVRKPSLIDNSKSEGECECSVAPQQKPRPVDAESKPEADSPARSTPLPFPTWTLSIRKAKTDEDLLKMFQKVEINIPLLDALNQILKYIEFLKELCVHKRKKIKGGVELGGIMSTLTRNEVVTRSKLILPKKCRDPGIFSIPCTIGECTLADAMLDLGASINVMPTSIYKSLNFGDLEPIGMRIQLSNRSVVQPQVLSKMYWSKSMS
ncbi:hypothetical protein CR513_35084, partial [Mucuna pruriens]